MLKQAYVVPDHRDTVFSKHSVHLKHIDTDFLCGCELWVTILSIDHRHTKACANAYHHIWSVGICIDSFPQSTSPKAILHSSYPGHLGDPEPQHDRFCPDKEWYKALH